MPTLLWEFGVGRPNVVRPTMAPCAALAYHHRLDFGASSRMEVVPWDGEFRMV